MSKVCDTAHRRKLNNIFNYIFVLLGISFLAISLVALNTVNAATNPFKITDVTIASKSSGVDATVSSFEDTAIASNATFYHLNDNIVYNITLKNTGDKDYTISSISDNNTSSYLTYDYSTHSGEKIAAGGNLILEVTITYTTEVSDITARSQNSNVEFTIDYEEEENEEDIVVPNTSDNETGSATTPNTGVNSKDSGSNFDPAILIVSALGIILLSIGLYRSKLNKGTKAIVLTLLGAFITISTVNATSIGFTFQFNTNVDMNSILAITIDGQDEPTVISYGDTLELTDPTPATGYKFSGWKDEAENDFNPSTPITGDVSIHPSFIPIQYTISIDTDGDGNPDTTLNATYDTPASLPANTAKTGYTAGGWTDGTNTYEASSAVQNLTATDGATVALTPIYTEHTYTITFLPNGGTGTMEDENFTYTQRKTLTKNTFTYNDHIFTGWGTSANGEIVYADEAEVYELTPDDNATIELYAQWEVIPYAMLDTGQNVNTKIKRMAHPDDDYDWEEWEQDITHIWTADALPEEFDTEDTANIISDPDSPIKVYAWYDNYTTDIDGDGYNDGLIRVYSDADTIKGNADMSCMFFNMYNLWSMPFLGSVDTSNVTNMSYMFSYMDNFYASELPDTFDTSNVTDMSYMFSNAYIIDFELPEAFNTSNVTDMSYMFYNAYYNGDFELPETFNTAEVTDMSYMFYDMFDTTTLTLPSTFNTSNVTNMDSMFRDMSSLTTLTLPDSFDTSNVTDMNYMFYYMPSLTTLTLPSTFNTSNVTNMDSMFRDMPSLTTLTLPEAFNTSNVTNMSYMFSDMSSLTTLTLPSTFNTSKVTDMSYMFYGMSYIGADWEGTFALPEAFDTSSVTNMSYMFAGIGKSSPYMLYLLLPDAFVIKNGTNTTNIFKDIKNTSSIYSTDATVQELWDAR